MATASDLVELRAVWSEFLVEFARIFTKLRKGAERGAGKGWSDQIEHTRRTDELLSYLMHARNADEHGIAEIASVQPGHVSIKPRADHVLLRDYGVLNIGNLAFGPQGIVMDAKTARSAKIDMKPAMVGLLPVVDRGQSYDPPQSHLGEPIRDINPTAASGLALAFARTALEQARAFLPPG